MVSVIVAIAGLVLGIAQAGFQEWLNSQGARYRGKVIALVNDIQRKMASNETAMQKLQNAYQNRNSELVSRTFYGMGFGPRMNSLVDAIRQNDKEFNEKFTQKQKENSELAQESNRLQQIGNDAGTVAGLKDAKHAMGEKTTEDKIAGGLANFAGNLIDLVHGGIKS